MLIENGADIYAKNKYGSTPLHQAIERGHKKVAQLLIENGADIYAMNNDKLTPLSIAKKAGNQKMIEILNKGKKGEKK